MQDIQMPLSVDDIVVPEGRRHIDQSSVNRLAESIKGIGLKHPVTVRRKGEGYVLVAGLHRLEAHKKLKLEHIPACIVSMTIAEARMWEIAENLHRSELTKLERAEQINEWRELVAQLGPSSQPRDQGIRKTAEALGVTRQEVQRSSQIAGISPDAKRAAEDAGLANNQSKLLAVASEALERQVAKVVALAGHPLNDFETKERWLATGMSWWNRGSKEWREEFMTRIEQPVMDARFQ